jgi:UDPglucose--hexose-1-phosphate uridylyltransferase
MPDEAAVELAQMTKYRSEHRGRHLLEDYAEIEKERERIVWQNDEFIVVCPWWATWPFEVLILPKRHLRSLVDLDPRQSHQFAEAIQEVSRRYDNLFECSFPYSK